MFKDGHGLGNEYVRKRDKEKMILLGEKKATNVNLCKHKRKINGILIVV